MLSWRLFHEQIGHCWCESDGARDVCLRLRVWHDIFVVALGEPEYNVKYAQRCVRR